MQGEAPCMGTLEVLCLCLLPDVLQACLFSAVLLLESDALDSVCLAGELNEEWWCLADGKKLFPQPGAVFIELPRGTTGSNLFP